MHWGFTWLINTSRCKLQNFTDCIVAPGISGDFPASEAVPNDLKTRAVNSN